jgi:GTPase SAR1 family protein
MDSNEQKKGKKISSTEMKDDEFFKQKADLKIILIGDSAVGKSK